MDLGGGHQTLEGLPCGVPFDPAVKPLPRWRDFVRSLSIRVGRELRTVFWRECLTPFPNGKGNEHFKGCFVVVAKQKGRFTSQNGLTYYTDAWMPWWRAIHPQNGYPFFLSKTLQHVQEAMAVVDRWGAWDKKEAEKAQQDMLTAALAAKEASIAAKREAAEEELAVPLRHFREEVRAASGSIDDMEARKDTEAAAEAAQEYDHAQAVVACDPTPENKAAFAKVRVRANPRLRRIVREATRG